MLLHNSVSFFRNKTLFTSKVQFSPTFVRCTNKCRDTKANIQSFRNLQAVSNSLESRFFIVRLYNLFVKGTRNFYADFKQYFKVKISKNSLYCLTLKEIELLEKMPKDIRKIAPFLVISLLPIVCYLLLPFAYLYPRQLLCRHFWNEQQRTEYDTIFLQKRLLCHSPILRHLHLGLATLPETVLKKNWHGVLELLKVGIHPHPDQILTCKGLFMNRPYALMYLNRNHIKHLLKMHELHMGWFRRTRLGDRAIILHAMDHAIIREGGVEVLSTDSLRNACLIRGLNPMNMKNEDMINWLKRWIAVSCEIDKNSLSLLLHCPVLLGYNEPTNWQLIYFTKRT